MAKVNDIKTLVDSYGVAVRAGVITPQSEDEVFIRNQLDMPEMSAEVLAEWAKSGNTRAPITIAVEDAPAPQETDTDD